MDKDEQYSDDNFEFNNRGDDINLAEYNLHAKYKKRFVEN